jgi:hypothetical protein
MSENKTPIEFTYEDCVNEIEHYIEALDKKISKYRSLNIVPTEGIAFLKNNLCELTRDRRLLLYEGKKTRINPSLLEYLELQKGPSIETNLKNQIELEQYINSLIFLLTLIFLNGFIFVGAIGEYDIKEFFGNGHSTSYSAIFGFFADITGALYDLNKYLISDENSIIGIDPNDLSRFFIEALEKNPGNIDLQKLVMGDRLPAVTQWLANHPDSNENQNSIIKTLIFNYRQKNKMI